MKILIYALFFSLFLGCKKKEVEVQEPPPKPPVSMEVSPPKYETYQYLDMGRRDPFISLNIEGSEQVKQVKEEVIIEREEERELKEWVLSAIIWDKNERIAFIKTPDENYIFARGVLFDRKGEPVLDIKARIKDDGIILVKDKKERFLKMEEKPIKEEIIE